MSPGNVGVTRFFCGLSVLRRHFSGNVSELIAFWVGGFRVRARLPVSGSSAVGEETPRSFAARATGVLAWLILLCAAWNIGTTRLAAQQVAPSTPDNAHATAAIAQSFTDSAEPPQIALCTEEPELPPVVAQIPDPPAKVTSPPHQLQVEAKSDEIEPEAHKHSKSKLDKYDVRMIGERDIGRGMNFYSLEREQALGRELASEIESQSRMVTDPLVTEYINRIGQTLVRNSDARVPFVIKVVDNDEVNAFALPGGFFYVNTGLILAADNEAELAGVMAHEIAHVAARHATKNATRAQIWNMASIPLIFLGGPAGYAIREIAGLAIPMSFLKFSRDAEREADLLGVEYEYASGYDPAAFVQFFEKLHVKEKEKHSFIAKAFTTHPMTGDRIKRAQEEIGTMLPAKDEYVVDTSEFQEVKAHLSALMLKHQIDAGQSPRPTLRKRGPEDQADTSTQDDRPTLKKRPN